MSGGKNPTYPLIFTKVFLFLYIEAAEVLTLLATGCSSDDSGRNSAQQQSYSENSQLHLDHKQLRESQGDNAFFNREERAIERQEKVV